MQIASESRRSPESTYQAFSGCVTGLLQETPGRWLRCEAEQRPQGHSHFLCTSAEVQGEDSVDVGKHFMSGLCMSYVYSSTWCVGLRKGKEHPTGLGGFGQVAECSI